MVAAIIPAGVFYISGRISSGMFLGREIRASHFILILAGATYPSLAVLPGALSEPYEKIFGLLIVYFSPIFAWLLLSKRRCGKSDS
jgi:hypothetical protein